jgi:hypothetical protein
MRLLAAGLVLVATSAQAEDLAAGLRKCAAVSDSLQRLVCYDKLAADERVGGTSVTPPLPVVSGSSSAAKTKPRTEATSSRCQATTKKGTQCKRTAKAGSSYCWQHGG